MEKFFNNVWGAVVTAIVFLITIVFCYQIIFNYNDLLLAILSAIILSIVVRYIIAELLADEIDFNIIRDFSVIIVCSLITYLKYY